MVPLERAKVWLGLGPINVNYVGQQSSTDLRFLPIHNLHRII